MRRIALASSLLLTALAAVAASSCAHGQRTAREHEVRSRRSPALVFHAGLEFSYLGHVSFAFGDDFEGERFVFGEVTQQKTLPRLLIVQFEHVKPRSKEIYRYNMEKAEAIGAFAFVHNNFAFAPSPSLVPTPHDEGELTNNFLLRRGYAMPSVWLVSRFVTLGGADRKSEMIVFYMEGHDDLHLGDLYDGEEPTPAWQGLKAQIKSRARSSFTIE